MAGRVYLTFGASPVVVGRDRNWSDRLADAWFEERAFYGLPGRRWGTYSDIKVSVGDFPGPLEAGVLDRPEPVVPEVLSRSVAEGKFEIPASTTVWLPPDVYKTDAQREVSEAAARALEAAVIQEDDEVSHDWGHLGRQILGGVASGLGVPGMATPGIAGPVVDYSPYQGFQGSAAPPGGGGVGMVNGSASCEPCGPRYLTYDCKTGTFKPRRRRRRRRLLTPTDIADLAALAALAGKGASLQAAIAQAVRR